MIWLPQNKENIMPFPPRTGVKIGLIKATPTPLDADALRTQLNGVGLNCAKITDDSLNASIDKVTSQWSTNSNINRNGPITSYGIKQPSKNSAVALSSRIGGMRLLAEAVPPLDYYATGNWTLDASGDGYGPQLEVIQYPDHFNWLYANRANNGFTGVVDNPPPYTGYYSNADAIETMFVNVGITASATLVKGLDQDAMKAVLSNAIKPMENADLSNYDQPGSLTVFLVDNYNETTKVADGLGVLFIIWRLTIDDYKKSSEDPTHYTTLTIQSGSVLYSDPKYLCGDYNKVLTQFGITGAPACS
jgi:hypothetical protein